MESSEGTVMGDGGSSSIYLSHHADYQHLTTSRYPTFICFPQHEIPFQGDTNIATSAPMQMSISEASMKSFETKVAFFDIKQKESPALTSSLNLSKSGHLQDHFESEFENSMMRMDMVNPGTPATTSMTGGNHCEISHSRAHCGVESDWEIIHESKPDAWANTQPPPSSISDSTPVDNTDKANLSSKDFDALELSHSMVNDTNTPTSSKDKTGVSTRVEFFKRFLRWGSRRKNARA